MLEDSKFLSVRCAARVQLKNALDPGGCISWLCSAEPSHYLGRFGFVVSLSGKRTIRCKGIQKSYDRYGIDVRKAELQVVSSPSLAKFLIKDDLSVGKDMPYLLASRLLESDGGMERGYFRRNLDR